MKERGGRLPAGQAGLERPPRLLLCWDYCMLGLFIGVVACFIDMNRSFNGDVA